MNESWYKDVLIAIPSINGGSLLARMLPTLRFAPSSVVVIDQGSTDDTAEVCAAHGVEILQLNQPHTYTQAGNIGARLARERGCGFLCLCNNDIAFRNDVMGAMYAAMTQDPGLAIVAPAQIVSDAERDDKPIAYRVFWDLDTIHFQHDTEARDGRVQRLEADFCELTCALVRLSAVDAIGFLDDEYGFYHEDCDFGFRLRKAGYSCAYLPNAQIDHFLSSTISREKMVRKADYIAKNKRYFARKHLGFAVGRDLALPDPSRERSLSNQGIQSCFDRYGLMSRDAPELAISHAAPGAAGYLYTGLEGSRIPDRWVASHDGLAAIFTTSALTRDVLRAQGIARCFHVPPGIDPDEFHPWGPDNRPHDGTTVYLAIVHGEQQQLLQIVLQAWHRFAPAHHSARLLVYGPGLGSCMDRAPDQCLRIGNAEVSWFEAEQVEVHNVLRPREAEELVELYRSADYVITGVRGDDSALAVLQAAACGVPCITVDARNTAGFSVRAAVATDYLVADMPDEPGAGCARLLALLEATSSCSASQRQGLVAHGLNAVRGGFTLRSTAMGLHHALSHLQIRRPSRNLKRFERKLVAQDEAAQEAAAVVPVSSPRRGLGAIAAQRIGTVGRVTERFGSSWQERGLLHATSFVGREMTYFVSHKASQVVRLGNRAARRAGLVKAPPLSEPVPRSALLIGYIDAQLGLGQSLRGLALALSHTTIPFSIYPFGVGVEGRRSVPYMTERYDEATLREVNVIEVAVGELERVFANIDPGHFDRSYNVLRTYWELSKAPESWRALLEPIDELWVPNAFVGESFRTVFDRTITIVPPCVDPERPPPTPNRPFGMEEGVFYFIYSFDYFSFPQRKNPFGVIRAFRRAFPDVSARVGLVIKSTGSAEHFPTLRHELRLVAQDDDRIVLIDEALTQEEMLALVDAADCYVSLHRSEGFGLGLAESMVLGKPVIATDYSGSTDFVREDTGYPVAYGLKPLGPNDYIYAEGQVWAEPDEVACADAMVRVFTNPAEVAAKTSVAKRFMADHHGPAAVGRIVEQRLTEIFDQAPQTPRFARAG